MTGLEELREYIAKTCVANKPKQAENLKRIADKIESETMPRPNVKDLSLYQRELDERLIGLWK